MTKLIYGSMNAGKSASKPRVLALPRALDYHQIYVPTLDRYGHAAYTSPRVRDDCAMLAAEIDDKALRDVLLGARPWSVESLAGDKRQRRLDWLAHTALSRRDLCRTGVMENITIYGYRPPFTEQDCVIAVSNAFPHWRRVDNSHKSTVAAFQIEDFTNRVIALSRSGPVVRVDVFLENSPPDRDLRGGFLTVDEAVAFNPRPTT
jgi:hypothetical protein